MGVKAEVMTVDEARELVSNQLLWPLVRNFLWDFSTQVHKSWIEGLGSLDHLGILELLENLMSNPRVKRHVLSSLGVEPFFHVFPKDDLSRVLLLDSATLESVAKWLGALACAESLRHVTDGATVRKLKAALSGVYPEVFGYTAYFTGFDFKRSGSEPQIAQDDKLQESVIKTGYAILLSAVASLPRPLVVRFERKLPKGESLQRCDFAFKEDMSRSAILKLLKLKFPEAYKLCCS